jgi:steroid delta-isomerase-like uncharacterized protein
MTTDNVSIGRSFFENVLGKGDWASGDQIMASDMVMYHPSSPEPVRSSEAIKGFLGAFRAGFPDLNMTVEFAFGQGEMVAVRWRARGTHTASLFGIPASGKSMNVAGISILRIVDGKIVEDWVAEDTIGLMQQIGVIPPMG